MTKLDEIVDNALQNLIDYNTDELEYLIVNDHDAYIKEMNRVKKEIKKIKNARKILEKYYSEDYE